MKLIPVNTGSFFKRAVNVAEHYGFRSVHDLSAHTGGVREGTITLDEGEPHESFDKDILSKVLKHYSGTIETRKKQPLMFYTPSIVSHPSAPGVRISTLTLNAVGALDPLSEIVVLKSAVSILEELGLKRVVVRVNSIGDSDSAARFARESMLRLRERMADLPQELVEKMRTSPSAALSYVYETRHPVLEELPSPLEYLTLPSRKYFKEMLELLEHTGIPFELDDKLYGDHTMYSHAIFEVVEGAQQPTDEAPYEIVARGGRYDSLTKAYSRSAVPSVGIVVAFQTKNEGAPFGHASKRRPSACLIHIGREARIRSISIVDKFRREKIPIEQCLHFERFSEQLAYAEARHAKYVIILGQREVHDGVVIVRNAADRSQRTVSIDELPSYFRAQALA